MKENRAFRNFFDNQKTIKKLTGFAWNFLKTPIQNVQMCLNPLFQRIFILVFSLFQKYLNPQVTSNKVVNSVVCSSCPSRLASRIHPFIFLSTSWGCISLQNACWIFGKLYIPSCVGKTFKFMMITFLGNALNLEIFWKSPMICFIKI